MSAPVRFDCVVLAFLGGVTCPSALDAQVTPPEDLNLLEVWSTEGNQIVDGITTITGLAETEDGRIWIADAWPGQGRVLVLDPSTMEAEVVGRTGDGPGEVRFPGAMAITPDGRIAVYDMGRIAIEIYGIDGEPFRRVQLRGATIPGVKGFAVLASGGYVVSGYARNTSSAIHYYDDDGWWIHGWRERYPRKDAFKQNESEITVMMAQMAGTGGPIQSLSDGSFLYSQFAPHEIVVFEVSSENGWTERPVVSMPELFEAPGTAVVEKKTENGQTFTNYRSDWPRSMSVFELDNGYILNVVDMGGEERWIWQIFDPKRAMDGGGAVLVGEASVDRRYGLKFLCDNGDILASVRNPTTGVSHAVRLRLDASWSSASAIRSEVGTTGSVPTGAP